MARNSNTINVPVWATSPSALIEDPRDRTDVSITPFLGLPADYGDDTFISLRNFNFWLALLYNSVNDIGRYGAALPWTAEQNYATNAIVTGSNGQLYRAIVSSGPASQVQNPVQDTQGTYWEQALGSSGGGVRVTDIEWEPDDRLFTVSFGDGTTREENLRPTFEEFLHRGGGGTVSNELNFAGTILNSDDSQQVATTAWIRGLLDRWRMGTVFFNQATGTTLPATNNTTGLATTAYVTRAINTASLGGGGTPADLSAYAELAGPTPFTGVVTVPTTDEDANTTVAVNALWVQREIAGFAPIDAPTFTGAARLNTHPAVIVNGTELVTAQVINTKINNAVILRAEKHNPIFTGDNVRVPTYTAVSGNDAKVASIGALRAAVAAASLGGGSPVDTSLFLTAATDPITFTGDIRLSRSIPSNDNGTRAVTSSWVRARGYITASSPGLTGVPTTTLQTATSSPSNRIASSLYVNNRITQRFTNAALGAATATTPGQSDDSTRIATTSYVRDYVAAAIPDDLNLDNYATFTGVNNFTGVVRVPNQSSSLSSGDFAANISFVNARIGVRTNGVFMPISGGTFTGAVNVQTPTLGPTGLEATNKTYVNAQISNRLLQSPQLRGIPTTSTPSDNNNSTQVASTMWTNQRIDNSEKAVILLNSAAGPNGGGSTLHTIATTAVFDSFNVIIITLRDSTGDISTATFPRILFNALGNDSISGLGNVRFTRSLSGGNTRLTVNNMGSEAIANITVMGIR